MSTVGINGWHGVYHSIALADPVRSFARQQRQLLGNQSQFDLPTPEAEHRKPQLCCAPRVTKFRSGCAE